MESSGASDATMNVPMPALTLYSLVSWTAAVPSDVPQMTYGGHGDYEQATTHPWEYWKKMRKVLTVSTDLSKVQARLEEELAKEKERQAFRSCTRRMFEIVINSDPMQLY